MLNFFTEPTQGLLEVGAVIGKLILFKMFLNLTALILFSQKNYQMIVFVLFVHRMRRKELSLYSCIC